MVCLSFDQAACEFTPNTFGPRWVYHIDGFDVVRSDTAVAYGFKYKGWLLC
jgi:hypothetical protein